MTRITTRFQSHQVLGRLLQLSLTPVAITVNIEVDLLGESPKADALLLRRQGRAWNAAQRARLPDGVRDSAAGHVLIEFKYTESVTERALAQAVAYDHFYRQAQRLPEEQALSEPEVTISSQLHAYMFGLQETLDVMGESNMAEMLTPDRIMEIGEKIRQRVLDAATPEERLAGLDLEERLRGLTQAERRHLLQLLQKEASAPSGDITNSNDDPA